MKGTRSTTTTRTAFLVRVSALGALGVMFGATGHAAPSSATQPQATSSPSLPAVGTVTHQVMGGQRGRVSLMSGVLTAPSQSSPEDIASRYLATRPAVLAGVDPASLQVDKVTAFHRGHAVRYRQTYKGLPVIGGATVVRMDEQGRVRWVGSGAQRITASISTTPLLTARQILSEVGNALDYQPEYVDNLDINNTTRLVIYTQPNMAAPRLAYWVELPADMTRMQTWRGYVDAETGYIYRLENKVLSQSAPTCAPGTHRAYIYEHNPIDTPDLTCVSLADMLPSGATMLGNEDIATGNCIDNNNCRTVELIFPIDVHWCDDNPTATTNASGDFTDYAFVSDTELDDSFAEVQMFYHANKAYEKARSLGGFTNLDAQPLGAIVNFRSPVDITGNDLAGDILAQSCSGPTYTGGEALYHFDNAFFVPAGGFLGYPERDSIVFGQGMAGDFAYDGDVITHEFGHAVMATVAPNLSMGYIDQYGFNPTPGGMHEGYADLLTMFVTNDPEIGEYAGMALGQTDIRNIDNDDACPGSLIGEVHYDSLPFTGAVWEAREAVAGNGAQRRAFDEAIFAAQQTLTETDDFTTAAAKTAMEIEAALGADAGDQVRAIFADRGLDGCDNRVLDGSAAKRLMIVGTNGQTQATGAFPAPVQFRYDLPEGAASITLDIQASQVYAVGGVGGQPTLHVGIKQGEEIRWTVAGGALSADYTASAPVSIDATTSAGTATLAGPFAPGTYYLQLFVENGALILANTSLSHEGTPVVEPDAGPEMMPDAGMVEPDAAVAPGDEAAGCGCAIGASPAQQGGALALGLLTLVAVAFMRRRWSGAPH